MPRRVVDSAAKERFEGLAIERFQVVMRSTASGTGGGGSSFTVNWLSPNF